MTIVAVVMALLTVTTMAQTRRIYTLNGKWQHVLADVAPSDVDAAAWHPVDVPHTWNAQDGTTRGYYRGPGSYRYTFDAPEHAENHNVVLHFEGVSQHAWVYCNGHLVTEHKGAFTAFNADVTPFLKPSDNQLLVRATNALDSTIIPLNGDFTVFGGIYRPVTMHIVPRGGITMRDHGANGVYIRQNSVNASEAQLEVKARVDLESQPRQALGLRVTVIAPDGNVAGSFTGGNMRRTSEFYEVTMPIVLKNPQLWNGKNAAAMYNFKVELLAGGGVIDCVTEVTGLRSLAVDRDKGFFLNGEHYPLRGVNRHQDLKGKGWAITHADHQNDISIIKEIGANAVRLAHYPHSQYFYSLCDSAGILVWAELPFVDTGTKNCQEFDQNCCEMLVELIRQSYNHPSIFCWSLFNELGWGTNPELVVAQLNDLAHREDPTRLTVGATNKAGRPENTMTDLIAQNTYPGWYWSDPDAMKWTIAWNYKPENPPLGISEYGAGASIHHHDQHVTKAPDTAGPWHPEEWQSIVHEKSYGEIARHECVWGSFVWNMFDFASAGRNEGDALGINDKGLVTYDRKVRKDAFFFYKAQWNPEPMVYITSRRHVMRTQPVTPVKIYSNCDAPSLTVNGTVIPLEHKGMGVWAASDVSLVKGTNRIKATALKGDVIVTDSCEWQLVDSTAADCVNVLMGTALKGEGGTAPFVGTPHAMTNFLPQTRENKMGTMAYVYDDQKIMGLMASHQPTVWMGDYGYMSVMPQTTVQVRPLPADRALPFSHTHEHATPYNYSVDLQAAEGTIAARMSAASRAAIMSFGFPKNCVRRIIVQGINLNPALADWCNDYAPRLAKMRGWVKVDVKNNEIVGYNPDRQSAQIGPETPNFKGYFVVKFNHPIKSFGTWDGDKVLRDSTQLSGTRMGAFVEFANSCDSIEVRVGTSFISLDQARANIKREIDHETLASLAATTRDAWNVALSRITVDTPSTDDRTIFNTALYHNYLFPREFSEYGRYYSAMDDKVHHGISFNDFSLWDTFRATHPLMTLLEPRLTSDWITGLLNMYKEGGWLPMWPNPAYTNIMIGTHADAVIADAYVKGVRNYDVDLAYEAMRKDAMVPPEGDTSRRYGDRDRWTAFEGRAGATTYHSLGYVAHDLTAESVSRTLEYALDDWCIAQVARDLGHAADYDSLMRWSQNYRNQYNKEKGFMLPRNRDGSWVDLDDHDRQGLTEGSKWTYLFCVMQDIPGMIEMMGGNEAFAAKLDQNFDGGHYRHDNEPGHHYIYLYDYCGQPRKTQQLVRKYVRENYRNAPDGFNGNDDCGQMSAWYLFSAMGFYPVTPASGVYALGAPQFSHTTAIITTPDGDTHPLTIEALDFVDGHPLVASVEVDGRPLATPFITHSQLLNAHTITFHMAP